MTTCRMPAEVASTKNWSKNRVLAVRRSVIFCSPHGASAMSTSTGSSSPVAQRVKKSTPTAFTSGAAYGSSINGFAAAVACARAAATMVAVAPTLVARSQLSLSVLSDDIGQDTKSSEVENANPAGSTSSARPRTISFRRASRGQAI
jgi:hypothetical protein